MGASLVTPEAFVAYQAFVAERRSDFRRIAAHTNGEHSTEDVSQQALLTAYELMADKGVAMRFGDRDYRKLLLSHLYQQFVRYTETTVRRALRHRRKQDDGNQLDFLAEILPADEQYDPLHGLSAAEAAAPAGDPDEQLSQASAYLFLVTRCNNEVQRLADRLLISRSYCYRCLAQARRMARWQQPLAIRCVDGNGSPLQPKGWRRFRHERRPTQLQFAFVTEPTLWRASLAAAD